MYRSFFLKDDQSENNWDGKSGWVYQASDGHEHNRGDVVARVAVAVAKVERT